MAATARAATPRRPRADAAANDPDSQRDYFEMLLAAHTSTIVASQAALIKTYDAAQQNRFSSIESTMATLTGKHDAHEADQKICGSRSAASRPPSSWLRRPAGRLRRAAQPAPALP